jgi:hypothetical protein
VSVSSAGHRYSDVDLDDPNFERTPYDPTIAYGRSKTANIMFALEFDRRHRAHGVRATALHPGGIMTELARHLLPRELEATMERISAQQAAEGRPPFQIKTTPQGAAIVSGGLYGISRSLTTRRPGIATGCGWPRWACPRSPRVDRTGPRGASATQPSPVIRPSQDGSCNAVARHALTHGSTTPFRKTPHAN